MSKTKDFQKMFPDLSVSIIVSVQKHASDEAAVIASLQQLQSSEPSDEVKERMLGQLQDYQALGRQTILDVLKENLWEVDDAVVPLFNLLIAKEKATVENKANDILENLFQGMDKDELKAAIEKHDGDLNAAADEVVMKHLIASESPEQQKQREQNDLIKALKLRFATTPEDQIVDALTKAHWFPEQAVQILLRTKRNERIARFQQEFPALTASEIRGALERDDATTRVMLQVRSEEKIKAKPVKAVQIVKNEEREINREVRDITTAVEGHVAAKHPTALAKQALTHTMRLEGAGLINVDAPEAGNQQHKDGDINGLGLAVNTVPLRVPKVVEKGGKIVVAFDHVPTSANDWIGMYFEGQPETSYKSYQWVPQEAKEVAFTAPAVCSQVFFRYFQNKTYRASGTSLSVHIGPEFLITPEAVSPTEIKCSVQSLTEGTYPNLWVGIFNLNDKKNALTWEWAKVETPVTFQIPKAGSYLLRCYPEKGYDFAAEKAVTTEGTNKLDLSYLENKNIQINYSVTTVDPATDKVWIGIYKSDEEDNRQYLRYKFISTKTGTLEMKPLTADGNYEARLFAHGTYVVLNKSSLAPFSL